MRLQANLVSDGSLSHWGIFPDVPSRSVTFIYNDLGLDAAGVEYVGEILVDAVRIETRISRADIDVGGPKARMEIERRIFRDLGIDPNSILVIA